MSDGGVGSWRRDFAPPFVLRTLLKANLSEIIITDITNDVYLNEAATQQDIECNSVIE